MQICPMRGDFCRAKKNCAKTLLSLQGLKFSEWFWLRITSSVMCDWFVMIRGDLSLAYSVFVQSKNVQGFELHRP